MKRFVIRYGLFSGCSAIVLSLFNWYLIAKPLGYDISVFFGYLSIVASLLFIPVGIKYFKEKLNNSLVSFKQAFNIGFGISVISSAITFFYSMLFFIFLSDDFVAWSQDGMNEAQIKEAQLQLQALPTYFLAPWFQGLIMFFTVLLIGVIITLVSTLVLSSKKK